MVTTTGEQASGFAEPSWRHALTEDDWHRQLTTLEGWREFTTTATVPPELLPGQRRATLDGPGKLLYDEYRLDYHTRLAAVATPTLRRVVHSGRRLTLLNRHAISARRGLVPLRPGGLTEPGPCIGRWGWRSAGYARRSSRGLGW